jgi:endonuclease/exonuclease/phosphatase family metal-dependent hydrolase
MHTTILDLQKILDTNPDPHIIALTETKHRHIKSIWRHTLKNYKLIYNPSHYDKQTKRCSGGTILAIHKNAYPTIKPIHIPSQYQPYLAIALLTPKTGSDILAVAAYLPQRQNRNDTQTYQDTLQWLQTLLTSEHKHTPVILGGDLQATLSLQHHSYYKPLADFITNSQLQHLGDPLTPTFTPNNTPLDHWLLRLPTKALPTSPATTTAIPTEYSDHYALLAEIPQIGDLTPDPPSTNTYPTTRDHPPFILPIPKPLIDLYQLGNDTTRIAQEETLLTIQQLTEAEHITTDQIDIAAKMVVETIDSYHRLAQTIWPMTQPPQNHTSTKLHPFITKSDTRQLKRISRLRNAAKNMLPKPNTNAPTAPDTTRTTQTRTHATEVLQLADPPPLEDIPALCHRAITAIINKANRKLTNSLRKKEDQLYKKSPKR